jgi:hypothetical protein
MIAKLAARRDPVPEQVGRSRRRAITCTPCENTGDPGFRGARHTDRPSLLSLIDPADNEVRGAARRSLGRSARCSRPGRWSYLGSLAAVTGPARRGPSGSVCELLCSSPSPCDFCAAAKARPAPACGGVLRGATASSMRLLADPDCPFVGAVGTREDRSTSSSSRRLAGAVERRRGFVTGRACATTLAGLGASVLAARQRDEGRTALASGSRRQHHALRGLPGVRGSSLELGADARDRRRAERPTSRGSLGGGGPRT